MLDLMLRIPVFELGSAVESPEQWLAAESVEAFRDYLDVEEDVVWRAIRQDMVKNFVGEIC